MISVVIPIHNKLPHLDRSVQSVLNQTFGEFELLLIDDASTDGSLEKIQAYEDFRIRVLKRESPGAGGYAARNLGIQQARYDWISFLDADDEWSPNYLEMLSYAIDTYKTSEVVSVGWKKVSTFETFSVQDKKEPFSFSVYDYLENHILAWTGAISIKKNLLLQVGGFPSQNAQCRRGGDVDTWIRCLSISKGNIHIPYILAYYYQDTVNQVTNALSNPTKFFCAYKTLNKMYINSDNEAERRILRQYINNKIIQILQRTSSLDWSLIRKMYLNVSVCKSLLKIVLTRYKLLK